MMFADLVDLEDFADRLRGLGLALPAGADAARIEGELTAWIDRASPGELAALDRMLGELEQQFQGLMLPSVAAMVREARGKVR